MGSRREAVLACALVGLALPASARAEGRALGSIDAVHEACADARDRVSARLYVIDVEDGWRLGEPEAGALPIDTGRNLRALDGHVSLFIPPRERYAFEVDEAAARALLEAVGAGARLRVGFFLAFDDRQRQPCLVRNRHAVTTVRADVAFLELVSAAGERLARVETDRLRAWSDDREALHIEGEGPRGAVGPARFSNGQPAPEAWQAALGAARARRGIARCHREGVGRGAADEGEVVIRLNVETRTGRIRRADVALSSLGDAREAECVGRALSAGVHLPPGPASWRADFVDLEVPVRLVTD